MFAGKYLRSPAQCSLLRLQITVYESLVFSARLRHSRETEQDIIFAFVREVCCEQ